MHVSEPSNLHPKGEPLSVDLGLDFHHLGVAVRQREPAIAFVRAMGYAVGAPITDPEQNVRLIMCTHPTMPAIEIVSPTDTPGPVDVLVERHQNGIVYHVCYRTADLQRSLQQMSDAGLRPLRVAPRKPAVLFGGRHVSFYNVVGMGLIELLEDI